MKPNEQDLDRRIDDDLRAVFAPPAEREFAAMAERVAVPSVPVARPIWPWLAAAAALLSVLFLLTSERHVRGPEGHDGAALGAMWVAAYHDAAAREFQGSCCEPTFDLPQACQDMFGCRIDVVPNGSVAVLGNYCGLATGGCMTLLARDGDAPVCIYLVPRDRDPRVVIAPESQLHLSRRELGDLVLYALAPAPADSALVQFVVP